MLFFQVNKSQQVDYKSENKSLRRSDETQNGRGPARGSNMPVGQKSVISTVWMTDVEESVSLYTSNFSKNHAAKA